MLSDRASHSTIPPILAFCTSITRESEQHWCMGSGSHTGTLTERALQRPEIEGKSWGHKEREKEGKSNWEKSGVRQKDRQRERERERESSVGPDAWGWGRGWVFGGSELSSPGPCLLMDIWKPDWLMAPPSQKVVSHFLLRQQEGCSCICAPPWKRVPRVSSAERHPRGHISTRIPFISAPSARAVSGPSSCSFWERGLPFRRVCRTQRRCWVQGCMPVNDLWWWAQRPLV